MRKAVLLQSPAHLYEVVPIFYKELNKLQYFDIFYLATDQKDLYGLGENVRVVELERDLGRANNFLRALEEVQEDIFVMMCDDHIVRQSELELDRYYRLIEKNNELGRLQLSPPSVNYLKYMRRRMGVNFTPDYAQEYNVYPKEYRWHVNFQPSLWRKEFFKYCIGGGENRNKLEIRAGLRGKQHSFYRSGFIFEHAVQVENFYASCKVYTADPGYDRTKNAPHYREEFIRYSLLHKIRLKSSRNVYVKRKEFVASVPLENYLREKDDDKLLERWAVKSSYWRALQVRAWDQLKMTIGR
jgi:hypothetical protein